MRLAGTKPGIIIPYFKSIMVLYRGTTGQIRKMFIKEM